MSIASMSGLTVKLGSPFPEGTAWDATLKRIAAEWRTISDGKVRMNVYPGGVAGNEDDMIRKMRIGQLDAAVFTIFGMKKIVPNSFVMALPGILESEDELDFAIKEFAPRFDEDFINQGFHVLAWSKTGWANFFTASPARTPQLMRKEKLSISNTDSELAANFKALKFNVVPMAINEVIVALQSGMATATYGPPLAAAAYQWFSQVPFMLDYKLAPVMGGIVISERTWRRIPQEYRKGLKAAIETAADDFHIESERLNKEAMHVMKEHGLKIINLSEQEIQDWIKVFTDGHALLIGQWIDEEVYRDFINGLKKMRN
ncbi:MAG: hypothetical protein B6D68_01820 [spirochete symbiont of Stewartia floridana]|nr:MAG: hypothetical protein B6D68_01820 [spirochete symbiont of Stewartia floridana]